MSMAFATLFGCQRTQKPVYGRPEERSNVGFAVRGRWKTSSAIYCRTQGNSNGLGERVFDSGIAADSRVNVTRERCDNRRWRKKPYMSSRGGRQGYSDLLLGFEGGSPSNTIFTGLQVANVAPLRSKNRSRGPPGKVSYLTLGQKSTWLASQVSLPREVPDPSQFQSDSEPQGEEFEDAQSYQDSRNTEAGSAVTEGAYAPVAARRLSGSEDGGSLVSQSERRKSYNPNFLGTQGSVTGNREVQQKSAWVEVAADGRRTASVEADITGVINRSSSTGSVRPSEERDDEE
ncbi:hypothetical protein OUZ56_003449 [Daphnia magna]|uniref:Uncharacterized protein n=1 Tax=Daphnia magna TaxID=35525 RepID=A0ABR0A964_9CRUS|nr:hypothetical protein OUZ56_003449 [Daphnia magna]